ncbi:MAG: gliding motility protein GldN [Cryomorphaceae bacterium]|jgi:gliding motility associated protien GldN|nr:gliding motility protein GldN [Cryomorphaceae bacterium]
MNKLLPILAALLFIVVKVDAQVQNVLDGAYVKEHNATKRVIPYPYLREADVMYANRVWQRIDMREKMNQSLYYPIEEIEDRKSLFDVIKYALITEGSLTAYSLGPTSDDDEFHWPMEASQLDSLIRPVITQYTEDPDTGERVPVQVTAEIKSADITQYEIKEDWIFDKQRSERYVRIIGICPMKEDFDDQGNKRGYKPLFWLYFPECRYVFANHEVFNLLNDSQRRTFEDIFQKRMFTSYVVKESNVFDRSISSYARNIDALLESERIKTELFEMEHDLWHY